MMKAKVKALDRHRGRQHPCFAIHLFSLPFLLPFYSHLYPLILSFLLLSLRMMKANVKSLLIDTEANNIPALQFFSKFGFGSFVSSFLASLSPFASAVSLLLECSPGSAWDYAVFLFPFLFFSWLVHPAGSPTRHIYLDLNLTDVQRVRKQQQQAAQLQLLLQQQQLLLPELRSLTENAGEEADGKESSSSSSWSTSSSSSASLSSSLAAALSSLVVPSPHLSSSSSSSLADFPLTAPVISSLEALSLPPISASFPLSHSSHSAHPVLSPAALAASLHLPSASSHSILNNVNLRVTPPPSRSSSPALSTRFPSSSSSVSSSHSRKRKRATAFHEEEDEEKHKEERASSSDQEDNEEDADSEEVSSRGQGSEQEEQHDEKHERKLAEEQEGDDDDDTAAFSRCRSSPSSPSRTARKREDSAPADNDDKMQDD